VVTPSFATDQPHSTEHGSVEAELIAAHESLERNSIHSSVATMPISTTTWRRQHDLRAFSDFLLTVSEPFPHNPDEIQVVSEFPGKSFGETNNKTPSLYRSDSSFVTICHLDAQEYYFEGIDPPREKTPPSTLPPLLSSTEGQPFLSGAVPSKLPSLDSPTVFGIEWKSEYKT
jgi:hypothetical protein